MGELAIAVVALAHRLLRVVDDGGDVRDVGDVRDIDVAHVARADAVGRYVDLARRQRHPADSGPATHGDADLQARPADPGDQRRRVDRAAHVGARRPAPAAADVDPATVVERRKAPGRVVDPGPAPGRHPGPAAGGVRRPAGRDAARHPQRAVLGVLLPGAVAVEVFDAGHLGRDVARRDAAVVAAVAFGHPAREGVAHRFQDAVLRGVGVVEPELGPLVAVHGQRAARALVERLAGEHGDAAGVVFAVETVAAGALGGEAAFTGAQLELRHRLAAAQAHGQAATVQMQRQVLVVEPQHLELAATVQAQGGRADADLRAPVAIGGHAVAGGQRAVAFGGDPFALFRVVEPHLALHLGDAADAAGRVDRLALRLRGHGGGERGAGLQGREGTQGRQGQAVQQTGGVASHGVPRSCQIRPGRRHGEQAVLPKRAGSGASRPRRRGRHTALHTRSVHSSSDASRPGNSTLV